MKSASSSANNRKAVRKSVLFSAQLTTNKGATSHPCTIRDLSPTGARIGVVRGVDLPAIVHLVDFPNRTAYEAAVVWKRAPLFGLAFIQSYSLTNPETPLYLRKLWFASAR